MLVRCENCGAVVNAYCEPVVQLDHDADVRGPAYHIVVGGGWLVHQCEIFRRAGA